MERQYEFPLHLCCCTCAHVPMQGPVPLKKVDSFSIEFSNAELEFSEDEQPKGRATPKVGGHQTVD